MDVSDGLAGDLGKLCRVSGVGAEIDAAKVPLSKAARAALVAEPGLLKTILTGGDDFEVVATVPPASLDVFLTAARVVGVSVTAIGRVTAAKEVQFIGPGGRPLSFARASFSHF